MLESLRRFFFTYGILLRGSLRTTFQIIYGVWKISKLPRPIITIFGGSRLAQDTMFARQAHLLAHKLVGRGMSVITGGGPGIMEAVSCGVRAEMHTPSRTLGITVKGLADLKEPVNKCIMDDYIVTDYFFARKYLLINYSVAFAVFPGGIGTLEELAEVLTLIQTKNLAAAPIVLIGVDYWRPFVDWLRHCGVKDKLVSLDELELFCLTDDLDEAAEILQHVSQRCDQYKKKEDK